MKISMDVIPSLKLEQGWDSNLFNTSSDETSDFFFRSKPELVLRWNTPGASIFFSGSMEGTWYYNYPYANQDPTWNLRIGLTGGQAVQVSSALSLAPSMYYINTRNTFRRTQLLPSGDAVLPQPTISTTSGNVNSTDFGAGLSMKYMITPSLAFGVGGNYGERRFTNDNVLGLTNSSLVAGDVSVSYNFSKRFFAGVGIAGSRETSESDLNTEIESTSISLGYQFSPEVRSEGSFGISQARQTAKFPDPERKSVDPFGKFNIYYASGTFSANVFASASYTAGSGYGGIVRQETVGIGFVDQFAGNWHWNISGLGQRSKTLFGPTDVVLNTIYGTGGLRYQILEWATIDFNAYATRQRSEGQIAATTDYYSALIGFTIGKPYKIF